jgi:3-oxoadipate enol-lactonase
VFREQALSTRVPIPVVVMQSQAAVAHDALDRLSTIDVPTMVIHGTADEMILVGNAELIAKTIPGARLELFDGAGHLFWWEDPDRVAALLREHIGIA